ncbi:UNVERIFIED_CONTAM: UPF0716 protein FxsA [Acetivibrio alkalicellulosi]
MLIKKGDFMIKLIVLFTLVPIIELYFLLKINQIIGLTWSMILIIVSGIVGAYLSKSEGRVVIKRIKLDLSEGRLPGDELIKGLCVLIGGAMLLTPGVITDFFGFTLIIPGTRNLYCKYIKNKLYNLIQRGDMKIYYRN